MFERNAETTHVDDSPLHRKSTFGGRTQRLRYSDRRRVQEVADDVFIDREDRRSKYLIHKVPLSVLIYKLLSSHTQTVLINLYYYTFIHVHSV